MSLETSKLLARFGEDTAASPEDGARLRAALPGELRPQRARHLLRSDRPPVLTVLVGGCLALAAAAVLTWVMLPPDRPDMPVAAALSSEGSSGHVSFQDVFALTYEGQGRLEGSLQHPRIQWEQGRVRVDADPRAMVDLAVITRDGEIWVEGTIFDVNKDLLGTRVEVTRGAVRVRCADGSGSSLGPDESATCLPTTAGGLLARARAQQDLGGGPDEVLDTVRLGLSKVGPESPVGAELMVLKIQLLGELGEDEEALRTASGFLASGATLRRRHVARTALNLATARGDCELARVALEALGDQATETEQVAQAACGSLDADR